VCVCVKKKLQDSYTYLASVYTSPDLSNSNVPEFLQNFESFLNSLSQCAGAKDKIVVAGYFNLNMLGTSREIIAYQDIILSYGLEILNTDPTRVAKFSVTLIDHVLINHNVKVVGNYETSGVVFSDQKATSLFITNNSEDVNREPTKTSCFRGRFLKLIWICFCAR
jgi:hypothetical protein